VKYRAPVPHLLNRTDWDRLIHLLSRSTIAIKKVAELFQEMRERLSVRKSCKAITFKLVESAIGSWIKYHNKLLFPIQIQQSCLDWMLWRFLHLE